jgi:hypothetical protein
LEAASKQQNVALDVLERSQGPEQDTTTHEGRGDLAHIASSGQQAAETCSEATHTGRVEKGTWHRKAWVEQLSLRVSQWWQHVEQGEGMAGLTQPQLAAATAGTAVLLYAMLAERRNIVSVLQKAGRGIFSSIADVIGMAFQLNPNPVSARHYRI